MASVNRTALWSTGHDESVEVNQRALIDKVLARYSGEFTVFRELLQNSDDAASKAVEIHFETQVYLDTSRESNKDYEKASPDLKQNVHQWRFRNNGIVFREEDWSRLKKIAEGNPDEEKIGAFGVGFYSLFSVTEEPFVKSGNEWMGFYWKDKKDQLFARRGALPENDPRNPDPYHEWTTFEMALREAAPIPGVFDFVRFLTSSITFMVHLEDVSVWLDGKRLAKVTKDRGVRKDFPVPKGLRSTSDGQMMSLTGVSSTSVNISVEVLGIIYTAGSNKKRTPPIASRALKASVHAGFFSSLFSSLGASNMTPQNSPPPPPTVPEAPAQMTPIASHIVLTIFSGQVEVRLNEKLISELHRSTKKNPPNRLKLELIYTGKDEYDASKTIEDSFQLTGSVFQGLRADLDGAGSARIYIGHATGQTTGLGGHISGRFIPTVERESIDLVDRNVATWNKELLYITGLLARVAYEMEISNIRNLWEGAAESAAMANARSDSGLREWLQNRVIHTLKFFTHHPSTPSAVVSNILEAAFFSSSLDNAFPLISTAGIMDARNIRAYSSEYSGFLVRVPILPPEVALGAKKMVDTLRFRGMIKDITFADVLGELRSRALTQQEMVECLKWRINLNTDGIHPTYLVELRREFLAAAIFTIDDGKGGERVVPLSTIRTVLVPRNAASAIPIDSPFPDHTLPFSVSKQLKSESLPSLLGWSELTIPDWLESLISPILANDNPEIDITRSPIWAEKVLTVLARAWPSLSKDHQSKVVALLKPKSCIPTKYGMKQPDEAYFLNANVFPDLPIVTFPKNTVIKGPLEKVLMTLGVRQHVNLQIVFDRMIRSGDWGIPDLIRYLVAVEDSLTPLEIKRLQETVAFFKEEPEPPNEVLGSIPNATSANLPNKVRFKAMDLYEPSDALRELKLPIIAWGKSPRWRASSEEAKFLFKLGLRRQPPLVDLLSLAAGSDAVVRRTALKYLLDNTSRYPDYDPKVFSTIAYVPAIRSDGTSVMCTPNEVFTDAEAGVMGFLIIDPSISTELVPKLKLQRSPPTNMLILILETRPTSDFEMARKWFEFMATHLPEFSSAELNRLSATNFIPCKLAPADAKDLSVHLLEPRKCYLGGSSSTGFRSQLFTFVDFGPRANGFLVACGVRSEPTVDELAKILVINPRNFFTLAGGVERFLVEIRNIAVNYRGISTSTRNQMKRSACLLGSRRVRASTDKHRKKADNSDDDEGRWEHDLLPPDKIAIVDDTTTYTLFDTVFSAPQEDIIEDFYALLGSPRLSNLVREEYKPSVEVPNSKHALEMRSLVLERLPLFLHERSNAKSTVSHSWLNNQNNFAVVEVGKLILTRTLQFGAIRMVKSQEASATADRKGEGPVRLYICGNSQVDLYEVSNSLCRVLLESHKPNDSLLFMTILSTDLKALRRRGFNVDRILRQQQAERDARAIHEQQQLVSQAKSASDHSLKQQDQQNPMILSTNNVSGRSSSGFLSNLRQKLHKSSPSNTLPSSSNPPPQPPNSLSKPMADEIVDTNPMKPYVQEPLWDADQAVTPHASIERNVRTAIEGCKPENNSIVRSNAQTTRIREAMDEGYCDTTGAIDLTLAGYFDGMFKVFVAGNAQLDLQHKKAAIIRFGDLILQPLLFLYNIPSSSCNIFYDTHGPLIAFNRNGSLFVNLRYYEAWHDTDVQNGDLSQARISWYFTLAHEIAHNLVRLHNSEHEFYFSTICEQHLVKLAVLVNTQ